MLLSFKVKNYRSYKDEAEIVLSSINSYKENTDYLISPSLPGLSKVSFLKAVGIFGPNASGKSSFLEALHLMRTIVLESYGLKRDEKIPYTPHAFDPLLKEQPTEFLVSFTNKDIRYEYQFKYNADVVTYEQLSSYPFGKERVVFTRTAEKDADGIYRPKFIDRNISIKEPFKPLLNNNMLLLSLLANFPNADSFEVIEPVFDWFKNGLVFTQALRLDGEAFNGPDTFVNYAVTGEILRGAIGDEDQREFIKSMLSKADVGITDANVVSEKRAGSEFPDVDLSDEVPLTSDQREKLYVVFNHNNGYNDIPIGVGDESQGTVQLFAMSGPVSEALKTGATLIVDEIDASIHPLLVQEIINCFLSPATNKTNAQLLFTAHNQFLLREEFLRRDQIWFTKKYNGCSELYPLSQFSPRNDESLVKGYLLGRYFSTPSVPECFGLCKNCIDGD